MPRPKANTKEGRLATQRWRETMIDTYGSVTERMQEIGAKGGSTPTKKPKGFAANPDLARTVGARGGRISKRRPKAETN